MGLKNNGDESFVDGVGIDKRFKLAQDNEPTVEKTVEWSQKFGDKLNWQGTFRDRIEDVAHYVDLVIADGREKEIAIERLEESLMWLGKAIFKE